MCTITLCSTNMSTLNFNFNISSKRTPVPAALRLSIFQLDVAIIGGGIAGLASAISLRAIAGVKPTVFESSHGFGYGGFGLALWPNGLRALRHMDTSLHDEVVRSGR